MRINFDFTDLEAFLAVKETGSFHLAGEKLSLSQSAITRRVRKLEEALGSVLFERTTREVRPTLAAKRLQLRAEAMIENAKETARAMIDESAAFTHQLAQTVTVATIPTVVTGLLAPALQLLREERPAIRIRLLDFAANEVAEAIAAGEADFGVCSVPMLEPSTRFELLFNDRLVLALPAGHSLCTRHRITWDALSREALILPARGTGNRLLIDEALAQADVQLRWTFEANRSTTALDLVSSGAGVAPLPLSALDGNDSCNISWRPLETPALLRPIGLIKHITQKGSAAADRFETAIRTIASEKHAGGERA